MGKGDEKRDLLIIWSSFRQLSQEKLHDIELHSTQYIFESHWPFEKPSSESLWEYEIWEKTDLRRWLNDIFFNKAFKTEEKFRIVQSEIVTKVYREGMCIKTEKTMDHVFILSAGELLRYVTEKGRSCRTLTSDEEYWEQSSSYSAFTGNVGYWLRSRGDDFMSSYWPVDYADQFGELYYNEGNPLELRGVRPAVWIETENHG